MLDATQFFTYNASENRAIAQFVPALETALATGKPTTAHVSMSPYANAALVTMAVRVCKESGSSVAVVASETGPGVVFVPLTLSGDLARARSERAASRRKPSPPPYRPHLAAAAG